MGPAKCDRLNNQTFPCHQVLLLMCNSGVVLAQDRGPTSLGHVCLGMLWGTTRSHETGPVTLYPRRAGQPIAQVIQETLSGV